MHKMQETKKVKKAWREIEELMKIDHRKADLRRARSVTVGTAFGGTTELMMRCNDGNVVWAIMQPVEVVELIHQLAGNIGCHIHVQPRKDFSSWREWRVGPEEQLGMNGHPPLADDMAPYMQVGANLPPPEEQPGRQPSLMNITKELQHEPSVATEENI